VDKLKRFLKETFNIHHAQNPDFFHEKYEIFGIDESRRIKELHLSKSFTEGGKKIFILEASSMTHEAQNSLLKIFEEPHEHSHFFLIMPSVSILLPTLQSRLMILDRQKEQEYSSEIQKFLKLSKKDKIAFVDGLAKRISDEEATKADALEFLAQLEHALHKDGVEKNSDSLKTILKARDYMNDRSPSIKQLLEYVALNL
jgi:DNA polymerase III gamma/tau subunit